MGRGSGGLGKCCKVIFTLLGLCIIVGIGILIYLFVFAKNDSVRLEFIPKPEKGNLIWYKRMEREDGLIWANKVDTFVKSYLPVRNGTTVCDDSYIKRDPDENIPCAVNVVAMIDDPCTMQNYAYGYRNPKVFSPCIIIKFEKMIGWEPIPYDGLDLELAEADGVPQNIITYIYELSHSPSIIDYRTVNTTWITCEGEEPVDKEEIENIEYYFPGFHSQHPDFGGIPNMFFPYLEQESYMEPFIFVKVTPTVQTTVRIKCKAWAKNIGPNEGTVTFELLID